MANCNRKYRPWTTIEDAKLTEALLNMVNTGGYKAENGFKSGYLLHLESVLKETLPDSNILANPHIASRMKTLRKDWQVVFDITNSSGFGYSKERNCVTADDAVWDAYIEKHPDASKWKNKKLPYFEELCVIFGNDRAQGSKARVAYEMEDEINVEEQQMNDGFDEEMEISHNDPRNIAHVEETSTGRSKKRKNTGEGSKALLETFKDAVILFSDSLKESSAQLSEGIKLEVELEKKTSMVISELSNLTSLSQLERFRAIKKIKSDPQNVKTFWDLKEEEREAWVKYMLEE